MTGNKPLKISNHGRITIPVHYRKMLGLEDGNKVLIVEDEGTLRIIPIRSTEDIRNESCTAEEMERIYQETKREDLEIENT